jgi:hypothetical protein
MVLRAFRGGKPLERIFGGEEAISLREAGVPFLWPLAPEFLKERGMGVLRPSGGANVVAGCCPLPKEHQNT